MIKYSICYQQDVADPIDWLHPAEMEYFESLKFEKRQNDWLLGRWTAKKLLKIFFYTELELNKIEIRKGKNRAPYVFVEGNDSPIVVSISHSHKQAICIASENDQFIGCDLEIIETRSPNFISDYFSTREKYSFQKKFSPFIEEKEFFTLCWSAKESVMKALRTGLSTHPLQFELIELERHPERWNTLKIKYLPDNKMFYGHWMIRENFVYVIVSSKNTGIESGLEIG